MQKKKKKEWCQILNSPQNWTAVEIKNPPQSTSDKQLNSVSILDLSTLNIFSKENRKIAVGSVKSVRSINLFL